MGTKLEDVFLHQKPYRKDTYDFSALADEAGKNDKKKCCCNEEKQYAEDAATGDDGKQECGFEKQVQHKEGIVDGWIALMAEKLEEAGYTANKPILYTLKNAILLNKPILIEGEPGVGKTSLAKAFAQACGMELIKIQFYSGITSSDILYEYDYAKQMLFMNAIKGNIDQELKGLGINDALKKLSENGINFYGKEFLIERPLLKAISGEKKCCLLLDEIDKSEEEVEHMLLEVLDTYSITIPEYGTVSCSENKRPVVFLTSNRYRELTDAMKRRCLYLYIEPKTVEETADIISKNVSVPEEFAQKVALKVNTINKMSLKQKPSISDSINWTMALFYGMGLDAFEKEEVKNTLGVLLKNKGDIDKVRKAGVL